MKKSLLLLGLISTAACLTACGSKTFDMSFEEALEIANHSELQDILSQNDSFEQSFDMKGLSEYHTKLVRGKSSKTSSKSTSSMAST